MIPWPRYCALLFVVVGELACRPAPGRSEAASDATRHPPGVVYDPRLAPPRPVREAPATDAILTLQTPTGATRVHTVVMQFFDAISGESTANLRQVLSGGAMAHFPNTTATSALSSWSRRFNLLDYRSFSAPDAFSPSEVEIYQAGDVTRLDARRTFHLKPGAHELLVWIPLRGVANDLFGPDIELLLTLSEEEGYVVRATFEDFTLS
jgi:hypothetical protein